MEATREKNPGSNGTGDLVSRRQAAVLTANDAQVHRSEVGGKYI